MTLWHLAWMFTSIGVSFVLTVTLPFAWSYAFYYSTADRSLHARAHWMKWRKHYAKDGLPCIPEHYAHGELVDVPGLGPMCPRCGWAKKDAC